MKRTTLFAEEELLNEFHHLAMERRISMAELFRLALKKFIRDEETCKPRLSFAGIGASGRTDLSQRCEELLWKKGRAKQRGKPS